MKDVPLFPSDGDLLPCDDVQSEDELFSLGTSSGVTTSGIAAQKQGHKI